MKRLQIDYRVRDSDVDSICRAHKLIDQRLQQHGSGRLRYMFSDPPSAVYDQIGDGVHQIGTTRMSNNPSNGVVNSACRVHGMQNLFIASSSVFPTSSQANPTLTIVAIAIRLADHLKTQHEPAN
jgi:choline dehydrogenase-like flavoprotein